MGQPNAVVSLVLSQTVRNCEVGHNLLSLVFLFAGSNTVDSAMVYKAPAFCYALLSTSSKLQRNGSSSILASDSEFPKDVCLKSVLFKGESSFL